MDTGRITAIFRECKKGYTSNEKDLAAIINIQQVDENLSLELFMYNLDFEKGSYYCILSDAQGNHEEFTLDKKQTNFFELSSHVDISNGFFAGIFYKGDNPKLIAYAVTGDGDKPYLSSSAT